MIRHNLPASPTAFIGRSDELDSITRLLTDPTCRLLTLIGQGGMGKTRLALEFGARLIDDESPFPDGVFFVPLQPLTSVDFLISAIAAALDIQFYQVGDLSEQLIRTLGDKKLLLILDNFEHLLDGGKLLSSLLAETHHLKILATSREALNLQEEWLFTISGMAAPTDKADQHFEDYSAVRLFIQHAQRLRPDFSPEQERAGIAQICTLTEGMPLALELAATWVRTLSCADIAAEIERGLDILETPVRNVPERHRSMRAVLEQSWKLLGSDEQETFARLSIFRGGFARNAAEAVTGASLRMLSALVNKSLLRRDDDGRYDIHEMLRQYAEERLQATAAAWTKTRENHAAYFANIMHAHWDQLRSSKQRLALENIESEMENIRAAWLYAASIPQIDLLDQSANSLWYFHLLTYREQDGIELLERGIAAARTLTPASNRVLGKLLVHLGSLYDEKYLKDDAALALQEGLSLSTQAGGLEERLMAQNSHVHYAISQYGWLIVKTEDEPHWQATNATAEENWQLAQQIGHPWHMAQTRFAMGLLALVQGNFEQARIFGEAAIQYARQSGDLSLTGHITGPFMGRVLEMLQDYPAAKSMRLQSNIALEQAGYWVAIGWNYQGIGYIQFLEGDYSGAARSYQQSARLYLNMYGHPMRAGQISQVLVNVGKLWEVQGRIKEAIALLSAIIKYAGSTQTACVWAEQELEMLRQNTPQDVFETAFQAGQQLDLETVAQDFLTQPLPGQNTPTTELLTEREVEILRLVAEGRSNREIAEALIFSIGTVKWYVNQIYSKLGVGSRTQAAVRARELHLLN